MKNNVNKQRILFCQCVNSNILPKGIKEEVTAALNESTMAVTFIDDLCGLAAKNSEELRKFALSPDLKIIACYPRAVKWLFHRAGKPLQTTCEIINMRRLSKDQILETLNRSKNGNQETTFSQLKNDGEWIPWFPTIDYSRCKHCKQCASFCIFGVYQITENGKVSVHQPQNCKTNCPACARICPEAAIIFPKAEESPINGDEIQNEQLLRANIKLNVEKMLGDDIYSALAERRKKAKKRLVRKKEVEKALEERKKCAEKGTLLK